MYKCGSACVCVCGAHFVARGKTDTWTTEQRFRCCEPTAELYFLRPFILHWHYLRAHTICTSCIRTTHGHKYIYTRVCNAYIDTNVLYMSTAIFLSINIDQSQRQTRTFITIHIICMTTHSIHSFLVGTRSRDDVALSHYWPRCSAGQFLCTIENRSDD